VITIKKEGELYSAVVTPPDLAWRKNENNDLWVTPRPMSWHDLAIALEIV
jgi:hypothetical protein